MKVDILAIAAQAMGVEEDAFNLMIEQGKVTSEEFLPQFAQRLGAEFREKRDR